MLGAVGGLARFNGFLRLCYASVVFGCQLRPAISLALGQENHFIAAKAFSITKCSRAFGANEVLSCLLRSNSSSLRASSFRA